MPNVASEVLRGDAYFTVRSASDAAFSHFGADVDTQTGWKPREKVSRRREGLDSRSSCQFA